MKHPLMRNNISRQDLDCVIEHLKQEDPILTNGPHVREFEEQWSRWLGVKYSVFVNSGSSANLISMSILKTRYPDGGEVIVPPLTWVSDIASVLHCGFTPVFADVNHRTLSMDTNAIISSITNKTRAVFITHAQGFDGITDHLLEELRRLKIPLIEDVCESHGATHNNQKCGTFGWMSNFSFYYAHHLSTIEGGMVCTDDEEVYEIARMMRSHGMAREIGEIEKKNEIISQNPDLNPDFIFVHPGYNLRNNEIGAIIGKNQLLRLDECISRRTENFERFLSSVRDDKYWIDFKVDGSSNYAFNIVLREPDHTEAERLMRNLRENQIEFRRGSAGGGNQLRQPYLQNIVPSEHFRNYKVTEHIHFFGFYVGNFPDLNTHEIDHLCSILNRELR